MSSAFFKTQTHWVDSSYIRQYPHALSSDQEDTLKIAVKQYTPLDNLAPRPGDVTIIAAHANGVGKELYEPLWEDLVQTLRHDAGFRIRSIWMADVAWQGESGVRNEDKLGNDPSWYDHPRDLLHFVNVFRKDLPRPLVGVGHSMGGNHVINLALMHPRLFNGLILIDPVVQRATNKLGNLMPAVLSSYRRDLWPSRQEAEAAFRRNRFYQSWDPRCLDKWVEYGLRKLPTAVYTSEDAAAQTRKGSSATNTIADQSGAGSVTLTTTKYQEVFTFLRGNYPSSDTSLEVHKTDHETHPDVAKEWLTAKPFYRPEPVITFGNLPHLRPPVLYIFASDRSDMSAPDMVKDRLDNTGTAVSGSGGLAAGAVKVVDIKDAGHFVPFEKPGEVAENVKRWVEDRLRDWRSVETKERREWEATSARQKKTFSDDRVFWTNLMSEKVKEMQNKIKSKGGSTNSKL